MRDLMVEDIQSAIDDFLAVEPNIITFHLEACKNKEEVYEIINNINKEKFAAKITKYEFEVYPEEDKIKIIREITIASKLNHPSIMKFNGYSSKKFYKGW